MEFNKRGLCTRSSLYLLLAYFVSFLIYYVPSFLVSSEALIYISIFLRKALYLILPMTASLIAFVISAYIGLRQALLSLIPMTAVRFVYLLPSFYLLCLSEGFDSIEGLLIGLGLSTGEALIAYAISLLLLFLMRFVTKKLGCGKGEQNLLNEGDMFNLSNSATLSVSLVAALGFLYVFITEIIDTVSFILDSHGYFRTGEIMYIVISFIYDIALLFVFHFIMMFIKNLIVFGRYTEKES